MADHQRDGERLHEAAAAIAGHRLRGDVNASWQMARRWLPRLVDAETAEDGARAAGVRSRAETAVLLEIATTQAMAGELGAAIETAHHGHRRGGSMSAAAAGLLSVLHAWSGDVGIALRWRRSVGSVDGLAGDLLSVPLAAVDVVTALDAGREVDETAGETLLDGVLRPHDLWLFSVWAATRWGLRVAPETVPGLLDRIVEHHSIGIGGDGIARAVVDRCRVDTALAQGDLDAVDRILADAPGAGAFFVVPQARLAWARGRPDEVVATGRMASSRSGLCGRDRVELQLLMSRACEAGGDVEAAQRWAEKAERLAGGLGAPGLLADASEPAPVAGTRPEPWQLLTRREHAVLREMACSRTLAEVAEVLSVSINTVKKQSVSIYAKLGVRTRAAALDRAREVGLLPGESRRSR